MKAVSDFRTVAIEKLNNLVQRGRERAANVLQKIATLQPIDMLVKADKLDFDSQDGRFGVNVPNVGNQGLHRNAVRQAAQYAGINLPYVDRLLSMEGWGHKLLATNLRELFQHVTTERYLLRSVDNEVRGFLTDKYKRIDSRPVVEAFIAGLQRVGALPYEGYALDTHFAIQAIFPELFEPIPGEIIAFGASIEHSDFGRGPLAIRDFVLRLVCTNGAIGKDALRQVHIGKRLTGDIRFSDEVYELDSKTQALAVRDTTQHLLSADTRQTYLDRVRTSHENKVEPKHAVEILRDVLETKGEVDKVVEIYNSADVEMLPAGNTRWRLSNALSWAAGLAENEEKKLDLQRAAGLVLEAAAA